MPQPDRPPPPPVVQRLRIRYAKRDRMRFTSHRDFQRALERALRRAAVPVAYSAGFSPHPKVSYLGAAPTGAGSEAEYLELGLAVRSDPEQVRVALDAALPRGLDLIEAVEAGPAPIADRVQASRWRVELPGITPEQAALAAAEFGRQTSVLVERLTKDGRRQLDARAALIAIDTAPGPAGEPAAEAEPCAILDLVVRHVTPAVRPDDILTGLRQVSALAPAAPPLVTRLAQGLPDDSGRLADPLAPDRERVATAGVVD